MKTSSSLILMYSTGFVEAGFVVVWP